MKRRALSGLLLVVAGGPASAEIHDYMIRRLLYLGTSCGVDTLERLESPDDQRRFRAVCRDVASYPKGVVVTCTDIADDRSCTIDTPPKAFDSLELLQPRRE
ncbi:hypothetical protein [Hyphomicrobium sp.]|uniref:hypothetical protein n=1 Tax=Hyphomicrobium sp. TaxID=82 RepID=UPI0025C2174F|nr:hypothetical protein [Hyphomicrobium sp.]MCC7252340.1 hypothetical protein [Hyphomicrobium sp.]